jgi:glycosyltransferase involved in cell wall biosynthesis
MAPKAICRVRAAALAEQEPMNYKSMTDHAEGVARLPTQSLDAGPLDGKTIIRFAHAFESGGGVERYLDDLDRSLLARNALTIVRLYIGNSTHGFEQHIEAIGLGSLVKIPLALSPGESLQIAPDSVPSGVPWKRLFRDWVLYNPLVWQFFMKRRLASWKIPRGSGQVIGAGRTVAELMMQRRVDLIMMHFFGSADADEIVREARLSGVPFAVLNHFSNDRFLSLSMRKHTMLASGVAGVNGLGLPKFVRREFCNLSDGIDTDFFQLSKASRPPGALVPPLILLPARVVRSKGHLDLVNAAAALRRDGIELAIGFAGRADSPSFTDELRRTIGQVGMAGHVHFFGELSVEQLRDLYGTSTVVALPTYHHEGLPRVNLEAQAMQVPIVAYATGGVPEGIRSGETGYLLKTGDIEGLILRLRELFSDAGKRKEMGEAGRRWVEERFSLGALAERHERFYIRVIASRRADNPPV